MSDQNKSLNQILRAQLSAVNQQFVHILALRHWGLNDTADKIAEIDNVDFPVAMKIINHLVASNQPIVLEPDHFKPGANEAEIFAAEQAIEQRLTSALLAAQMSDPQVSQWISAALAPRKAYAKWLAENLNKEEQPSNSRSDLADETAEVFSSLIAIIEQSMVHAFVHHHHGTKENADAAWATSGEAMMQATKLVRWLADVHAAPVLNSPVRIEISNDPDTALELDRKCAEVFSTNATLALQSKHDEAREICRPFVPYAEQLCDWEPGQKHPASVSGSPAFGSFSATLKKFVGPA